MIYELPTAVSDTSHTHCGGAAVCGTCAIALAHKRASIARSALKTLAEIDHILRTSRQDAEGIYQEPQWALWQVKQLMALYDAEAQP